MKWHPCCFGWSNYVCKHDVFFFGCVVYVRQCRGKAPCNLSKHSANDAGDESKPPPYEKGGLFLESMDYLRESLFYFSPSG